MSKHIQGIELAAIVGRRGYAPDIIVNTETDEQVAACANPDLTALFVAAPDMYDLISDLSQAYDDNQSSHELASRLYDLRCAALGLLAKIEGGGE